MTTQGKNREPRHLLSILDFTVEEVEHVLQLAAKVKADKAPYRNKLAGQSLAMIFEKPSTRTRISFEVGIYELGGQGLYLSKNDLQIGRGETIPDTAKVLGRFVSGIMARVFSHATLEGLAAHAGIPVINGLSDILHPCQGLTDYLTMREHKGNLKGLRVAYVGDGNNMAHSLANGAARVGAHFTIACPRGYEPDAKIMALAAEESRKTGSGATFRVVNDPVQGVEGADVVYTDVWTSMGQEEEKQARLKAFDKFRVDGALFAKADSKAIFMHCLPAHRGDEVTDEVADHPRSVIFDQAENRLHAQKAVMLMLMGGEW